MRIDSLWAAALLLGAAAAVEAQDSIATLVAAGEALLAAGDAPGAEATFDRGASVAHESSIEVSLVRTYMQAGQYRRALAFAAHAAGAHPDYPQATALYAWLLHVGGQRAVALRTLDGVPASVAHDVTLQSVRERLAQPAPVADGPLLAPPLRFAPYASVAPPETAVVASGTLLAGGRRALVPAAALAGATRVWLRNGVGTTAVATLERILTRDGIDLAVLELAAPLPLPDELVAAADQPFAGSVAYAAEYATTAGGAPAWPSIALGFLGRAPGTAELPLLGVDVPPGPHGGPVFDEAGRLAGLAVAATDGRARFVSIAAVAAELGPALGAATEGRPTPRLALDAVYERALRVALQVLVTHDRRDAAAASRERGAAR